MSDIISTIFSPELIRTTVFNWYYYIAGSSTTVDIVVGILIFLSFLLFKNIFTRYIFNLFNKLTAKTKSTFDDKLLIAYRKPIQILFVAVGLYLALLYLPLGVAQNIFISKLFRSTVVIMITWGLYELLSSNSLLSQEIKDKFKIDGILIPFFSKVSRFTLIAFAFVIIAQEWDYEVNGFIAGLGLGGLAFALAAQNMLANIFGGVVIVIEKPFSIGDWIATPSIEGTVEDISFRSTRIRAFNHSLITIPNSILANEPITNFTRVGKWRVTFHLGLVYSTPINKLKKCVEEIKKMLVNHPEVHPETILVHFERFADSSLDIYIYYFTNSTVFTEHHKVKEEINFRILQIIENEGASIAFPSHSVYLENTNCRDD